MMDLNITNFVVNGTFGCLDLNLKKSEIIKEIQPDDWLHGETLESSPMWRFGNFELHFDNEDQLESIFTDYVSRLDGGVNINIVDWWIIHNGENCVTLSETLENLSSMNIHFEKKMIPPGYIEVLLPNGVYFSFDYPDDLPEENENNWKMTAVGKRKHYTEERVII